MPLVAANGLKLHVQTLGAGPPVVMLHGLLLGSLASWYFTVAPSLARAHEVLLYDLRGHGRSERATSGYDVASMVGDLGDLIKGRDALTLVGHSYGALIALRFALLHPERVRRLVLIEAPIPPSQQGEIEDFLELSPERMVKSLPPQVAEFLGQGKRRAQRLLNSLTFLAQQSSLLADLRRERDIPDEELAELACPVLALYGSESSCVATGRRLKRVVPNCQLVELKGGHYLHLDATDAIAKHIAEFVGG